MAQYTKRDEAFAIWRKNEQLAIQQLENAAGLDHCYDALAALQRKAFEAGWARRKEADYLGHQIAMGRAYRKGHKG